METPEIKPKTRTRGKRSQLVSGKDSLRHSTAFSMNVISYSLTRLYTHLGWVRVKRLFGVTRLELDLMFCLYGYINQTGKRTSSQEQLLRTITRSVYEKKRRTGAWLGLINKGFVERVITNQNNVTYGLTFLGVEVMQVFIRDIDTRMDTPYQPKKSWESVPLEGAPIASIESLADGYKALPDRVKVA